MATIPGIWQDYVARGGYAQLKPSSKQDDQEDVISRGQEVRLRGSWRRWLPDRSEVVLHAALLPG